MKLHIGRVVIAGLAGTAAIVSDERAVARRNARA
jgi:hypothetical protein